MRPRGARTIDSVIEQERDGVCPTMRERWDDADAPPLSRHTLFDGMRSASSVWQVEDGFGFKVVTRHRAAMEVAQNPAVFPQLRRMLSDGSPQDFRLIPASLNGAEHAARRRVLGRYFSPGRTAGWHDIITARATELIDGLVEAGRCDFVRDFALRFPTAIFLQIMGLPVADLDQLLEWETAMLHPDRDAEMREDRFIAAMLEVVEYFLAAIADRRARPRDEREPGIVTEALDWVVDGEPVTDEQLMAFYLMIFMAGLDTVTAELGYAFRHLALNPADRQLIVDDPELVPAAVEELLRLYPIVNLARQAAADTEIDGCPVREGEIVMVALPSAGRDAERYPDALTADFGRRDLSHLSFGAGPHRCLGSHLARHEMQVALREWHRRIPHYRLSERDGREAVGIMMTLNRLELEWSAPDA